MKLIFLYAVFSIVFTTISLPQNSFSILKGSAIIGITRNDTIWFGADSKTTHSDVLGNTRIQCKIINAGNIVVAHLGLMNDFFTNINIDTIITNCVKDGKNTKSIINYLNKTMIYTLQYISTIAIMGNKYSIGDTLHSYHTGFLIATNEESEPTLHHFEYITTVVEKVPKNSFLTKTELISKLYQVKTGILNYCPLGFSILSENIIKYQNSIIPNLINELIRREIQKSPDKIGEPISIIQITKDNIKWIQRGLCK